MLYKNTSENNMLHLSYIRDDGVNYYNDSYQDPEICALIVNSLGNLNNYKIDRTFEPYKLKYTICIIFLVNIIS